MAAPGRASGADVPVPVSAHSTTKEPVLPVTHPVARTAFYCCALRAADAACTTPVCGDGFAARFVDEATRRELAPLLSHRGAGSANVVRHRLVDDLIRERLADQPGLRVILIGAGFDTRAFRLPGGRWIEIDDAALLAFKEERLPASSAPQPLERRAVEFERTPALDYLAPLAGDDAALVVIEGVSMYLDDATLGALAAAVRARLPRATLIIDLMTAGFRRHYTHILEWSLARFGARLATRGRPPCELVERAGYRLARSMSIVGRAREAHSLYIPGWLFHGLLRELRDGYAVQVFSPVEPPRADAA